MALALDKALLELFDLYELIRAYIMEDLPLIAGGPPNLQSVDALRLPQSNVLLQGRRPKRPSTAYLTVNESPR